MNRSTVFKLLAIGVFTVILAIALAAVNGVISERQQFRDEAVTSIEASYAGRQQIVGPVLVRPYTQTGTSIETNDKGRKTKSEQKSDLTAVSFPHQLDVRGKMVPSDKHHGLYSVTVYEFQGEIKGSVEIVDPHTEGKVEWGEPYLALSIADVRGIVGTPKVIANGVAQTMLQGAPASGNWQPDLRVPLRGISTPGGHLDFSIALDLNGTQSLSVSPVGDSNHVELSSSWPSPLFDGQFLPHAHDVSAGGFTSMWDVSSLASGTQPNLQTASGKIDLMTVNLLNPIDPYKLSDRATKYGILFVLLTFAGFFLFEMLKHLPIHPIQYLLVGFGLAIFFLLLISLSEHMVFLLAYVTASGACIGLLTFYLSYVLRSPVRGLSFGAMLAALYAAVYGLLISEDNSLILGSVLLFAVLAAVMIVTRKIDWYKQGLVAGSVAPPPPPANASRTDVPGLGLSS